MHMCVMFPPRTTTSGPRAAPGPPSSSGTCPPGAIVLCLYVYIYIYICIYV